MDVSFWLESMPKGNSVSAGGSSGPFLRSLGLRHSDEPSVDRTHIYAAATSSPFLSSKVAFSEMSFATSSTALASVLSPFSVAAGLASPLASAGVAAPDDFLPSFSLASSASIFSISFWAFSMF